MFCGNCGFDAGESRYCSDCGSAVISTANASPQGRPQTPPIPPPPSPAGGIDRTPRRSPQGTPSTADRLAVTGKVVGLSGCLLALVFWVAIPLILILIAIAATSSTGVAVVAGLVGIVAAFVYWVWRSTRS